MRDLTQTEINEVLQAEQKLRHSGLIVDEADGKEDMDHNTERILAFFDLNVNTPVTVQTILSACEQMRDQLRWKSGAQMEYEKLYNQLAKSQQDQFGSWWHKQGSVLILTENQGFENAGKILKWCQGRDFDARTFNLAMSNLLGSSGLHRVHESTFRPGRHSGSSASLFKKSDTNLSPRDHARRTAEAAATSSGNKPAPATDYKALAESITTGRTHSDSLRLQRFYVNKPNSSEIDWERTYFERRRIADGKGRA